MPGSRGRIAGGTGYDAKETLAWVDVMRDLRGGTEGAGE